MTESSGPAQKVELQQVHALIRELASKPASASRLAPEPNDWADAVDIVSRRRAPRGSSLLQKQVYDFNASDVHGYIVRCLGHLVVNPSEAEKTALLNSSYVFQAEAGELEDYANYSPDTAEDLVQALIESANRQRKLATMRGQKSRLLSEGNRFFALHGPRGSGKTIFVNYLLSKYSAKFDAAKVIWVRVNLVEDFGDNDDLMHWIHLQACKIIFRYYDPHSKERRREDLIIDCGKHLGKFIRNGLTLDDAEKEVEIRKLDHAREVFYSKEKDEPIRPALLSANVSHEAVRFASAAGYSFVVVLDGLDRLDTTEDARLKYKRLMKEANRLAASDDLIGLCLLVVTRNYNGEVHNFQTGYFPRTSSARRIMPIKIDDIIDRRLAVIEREIAALREHATVEEPFYADLLREFGKFLRAREDDALYIRKIGRVFSDNLRAQMQIVQMSYFDFLNAKHGKQYQLIEMVMRSGMTYPPEHYRFRRTVKGKIVAIVNERVPFDCRFCPSIFSYPHFLDEPGNKEEPHRDGLLMGLRILQTLKAHQHLFERRDRHEPIDIGDVVKICQALFQYERDQIVALLNVFVEFDLIRLFGRDASQPRAFERYLVELLPKATYLIDHFIFDIAYLNLAAMRVPISKEAFKVVGDPYFVATTYNVADHSDLKSWILAKFQNSLSLVRLIEAVSVRQEAVFKQRLGYLKDLKHVELAVTAASLQENGYFTCCASFKKNMESQFHAILTSLDEGWISRRPLSVEDIYEHLCRYRDAWIPKESELRQS